MRIHFLKTLFIFTTMASWSKAQQSMALQNDFNKQLNQTKLEKVLTENDYKVIISQIQSDVDLYRIDFNAKGDSTTEIQKLFRLLPQSPLNMNSILTALDIENVIGLFLPYEQLQNKYAPAKDALFIREDAGLWTLIHEYMHFLFNEDHRKQNKLSAPELKNAITDSTETYNEEVARFKLNGKFETESRKDSYIESLQNLCALNLQYILNFSVEEIVIEEQLQHKFRIDQKNNIHFLEVEEYNYSNKYISKNLSSAVNTTEYMLRLIDESKKMIPLESYQKIKAVLDSYKSKYTEILLELKKRNPPKVKPTQQAQVVTA